MTVTKRSELAQRRAEAQARAVARVANRAFTKTDRPLDRVARAVIARRAGEVVSDPELDHDR